jgi:hypothetical protein
MNIFFYNPMDELNCHQFTNYLFVCLFKKINKFYLFIYLSIKFIEKDLSYNKEKKYQQIDFIFYIDFGY